MIIKCYLLLQGLFLPMDRLVQARPSLWKVYAQYQSSEELFLIHLLIFLVILQKLEEISGGKSNLSSQIHCTIHGSSKNFVLILVISGLSINLSSQNHCTIHGSFKKIVLIFVISGLSINFIDPSSLLHLLAHLQS